MSTSSIDNFPLLLEDLHIESDKQTPMYFCRNFKVYPEGKEKNGGFMFGIIEIKATPVEESERIFQATLNTLKESYYQQIITSPAPQKLNLETILEFALNKTNQKITEMIEIGQVHLIKENFNFFIGIAKPAEQYTDIHFTNHGMMHAYLIHRTQKNNYKIINIVDNTAEPPEASDRVKIFSAITSGQMAKKDILVVCTEIFNNFMSAQKIRHILLNNPLPQALAYFRSQVKNFTSNSTLTHSALILKREEKMIDRERPLAQTSISSFISTTEQTEKLLTPSFAINIKKNISGIFGAVGALFSRKKSNNNAMRLNTTTSERPAESNVSTSAPKKNALVRMIHSLYMLVTGRKKLSARGLSDSLNKAHPKQVLSRLSGMHRYSKIIAVVIVVLVIGLFYSVSWAKKQAAIKQEEESYAAQVNKVKSLINDAGVSLIYKNENQSMGKIQEATKELNYLPQATTVQQSNFQDLQKQIAELKNKLLHIEKVVPQLVTEMSIEGQPVPASSLLLSNGDLYAWGAQQTMVQVNLANKKIGAAIDLAHIPVAAATDGTKAYFVGQDGSLVTVSGQTVQPLTTTVNPLPTDLAVYNGNLYVTSKEKQEIDKYLNLGWAFAAPTSWISSLGSANLSTATAMAIDGSIYVLNNDGTINKFHSGAYEAFSNPVIEPAVTNANRIITSTGLNDLYIFDPASKRLIIMNKNGTISKQLVFDSLDSVTDVSIATDGKTGYVLSGSSIYQFPL